MVDPLRPSRRSVLLALAAAATAPTLSACSPLATAPPGGIARVPSTGGDVETLTDDPARPVLSDDGRTLAWSSERGVWAQPLAGGQPTQLDDSEHAGAPAFSPDGRELAWIDAQSRQIVFAPLDGAGRRSFPLVAPGRDIGMVVAPLRNQPSWAPDGSAIAYVSWDGSGDAVYRIAPDGSGRRGLSTIRRSTEPVDPERANGQFKAVADAARPAWSPSGDAIAFAVAPETAGAPGGIYSVAEAGGRQRRLSPRQAGYGPLWSPTASSLLFVQHASAGPDLMLYEFSRRLIRNLTSGSELSVLDAAWSPDGRRVAFSANGAIYLYDLRTRASSLLADTPLFDRSPTWTPDGRFVLFMSIPDLFALPAMPQIP